MVYDDNAPIKSGKNLDSEMLKQFEMGPDGRRIFVVSASDFGIQMLGLCADCRFLELWGNGFEKSVCFHCGCKGDIKKQVTECDEHEDSKVLKRRN